MPSTVNVMRARLLAPTNDSTSRTGAPYASPTNAATCSGSSAVNRVFGRNTSTVDQVPAGSGTSITRTIWRSCNPTTSMTRSASWSELSSNTTSRGNVSSTLRIERPVCVSAPSRASPSTPRARSPTDGMASVLWRYAVDDSNPTKRSIRRPPSCSYRTVTAVMRPARCTVETCEERATDTGVGALVDLRVDGRIVDREPQVGIGTTRVALGLDVERRGAEEHEVTVGEPAEERIEVGVREHPIAHLLEVADDAVGPLDGVDQVGLERSGLLGSAPVDLELRPRLDAAARLVVGTRLDDPLDPTVGITAHVQHGVDQQVGGDVVSFEHHPDRVDEERDVGRHDEDDRTIGVPAVAVAIRRQHQRVGVVGATRLTERPVPDRRRVEIGVAAVVAVELGELLVVGVEVAGERVVVGSTSSRQRFQTFGERCGAGAVPPAVVPHLDLLDRNPTPIPHLDISSARSVDTHDRDRPSLTSPR